MEEPGDTIVGGEVLAKSAVFEEVEETGERAVIADLRVDPGAREPARDVGPLCLRGRDVDIVDILIRCSELRLDPYLRDRHVAGGGRESEPEREEETCPDEDARALGQEAACLIAPSAEAGKNGKGNGGRGHVQFLNRHWRIPLKRR